MTAGHAIEVRDLCKRYRKTRGLREAIRRKPPEHVDALRGLSLDVERGTVHGLLGANGAGKTTLLKTLATLVVPTSGSARVTGIDVERDPAAVRARIGMVVAEERSFYWRLSGRDNLLFFASLHEVTGAEREERVDDVLEVVGLAKDARRPYREYSSGMRQRLSIARGLVPRPEVLLLDEPTRALDPPSAAWIRKFVRERLVGERGVTVLVATHDLLEAETTCDRLSLVDRGVIVAEGTPAELKRPLDRASRTTVTLLPPHDAISAALPGGAEIQGTPDGLLEVTVPGGHDDVAESVRRLVERGGRVVSVAPRNADLASLFERLAAMGLGDGAR